MTLPLFFANLVALKQESADPWLRFLMAYHAGDLELCRRLADGTERSSAPFPSVFGLNWVFE